MKQDKTTNTYQKDDASVARSNRKFMAVYIIGLFSVALVLVLVSYLTQSRAEQQVQSISDQLGQTQSEVQGARQRAEQLQIQYDQLLADFEQLQQDYEDATVAVEQLSQYRQRWEEKEYAVQALAIFWKIEQAYQQDNDGECRRLINKLVSDGYADDLTGDALAEYQIIREAMGYPD